MTDILLLIFVSGVILLAVAIDAVALVGWLMRRWR
jgi:hypothetical protein